MLAFRSDLVTSAFAVSAFAAINLLGAPAAVAADAPSASASASDAELRALREEVRVLRNDMQRLALAIEPRGVAATPQAVQQQDDDSYYARTYAAADLALPLPKVVKVTLDRKAKVSLGTAEDGPTLDALEELIMSRVDPSSWVAAGGNATITQFPGNLSLVINQSEPNHRQIAELFEALRPGRRIVLEARVISGFRSSFLNRIASLGIPLPSLRRPQSLSAHQTKVLIDAAQKDRNTNLIQTPTLALVAGQLAQFCLPADTMGETNVLMRADADGQSQVRLTVVVNAQDAVDALRSAASISLRCDEPVLLDVPLRVASTASSDAIALADRLASSADGDGARALLMITPRVVLRDPRE